MADPGAVRPVARPVLFRGVKERKALPFGRGRARSSMRLRRLSLSLWIKAEDGVEYAEASAREMRAAAQACAEARRGARTFSSWVRLDRRVRCRAFDSRARIVGRRFRTDGRRASLRGGAVPGESSAEPGAGAREHDEPPRVGRGLSPEPRPPGGRDARDEVARERQDGPRRPSLPAARGQLQDCRSMPGEARTPQGDRPGPVRAPRESSRSLFFSSSRVSSNAAKTPLLLVHR